MRDVPGRKTDVNDATWLAHVLAHGLQKTLEDANLKLASAVSNIMGKSGRAMLDAIVAGETDPAKLVEQPSQGIVRKPSSPFVNERSC